MRCVGAGKASDMRNVADHVSERTLVAEFLRLIEQPSYFHRGLRRRGPMARSKAGVFPKHGSAMITDLPPS